MKDFYTVTKSEKDNDTTRTSLKVNAGHELYNGHFPGRPVTPGVVLMQLFKEEAERISEANLSLKRASNVKFTAVFDPTDNDELILESKLEKQGAYYELKGIAKSETGIITKINALYEVL